MTRRGQAASSPSSGPVNQRTDVCLPKSRQQHRTQVFHKHVEADTPWSPRVRLHTHPIPSTVSPRLRDWWKVARQRHHHATVRLKKRGKFLVSGRCPPVAYALCTRYRAMRACTPNTSHSAQTIFPWTVNPPGLCPPRRWRGAISAEVLTT